ncbi:hypothetical protein PF002_g25112 [Phytophthora fragariae]|nr:hypothetical protein PF007_g21667 [Phytophthora fragariae]KAE9189215.1 hypothetical protein PF002_g25112 [Phytophthora fragariae]
MERIIAVKNTLRDVGSTLDWIEDVNWKEGGLTAIGGPFNDEHMLSKAERKGAVMSMPLCTKYLNTEATSGASLLVYRQDMWLNSTCMITAMMYMQRAYECVGIVNPAFYHSKSSVDKIRLASAFRPFDSTKRRVIGVLNVAGLHWVVYYIDRDAHVCYTFDPLQGKVSKMTSAIREIIEP